MYVVLSLYTFQYCIIFFYVVVYLFSFFKYNKINKNYVGIYANTFKRISNNIFYKLL